MLNVNYNPDVLSCLANLSSDEVFTPPRIANQMLDLLPEELWSNKEATFLDPATKSGIFLREIAGRLMEGLEEEIPDLQTRVNHIMTKQLFGIGITELTSLLARRSVYCSKHANGEFSVCDAFDDEIGNIFFNRVEHDWKNGRCTHCGASQQNYSRDDALETHAYQFIHGQLPERIKNMKFDVIIGNPPYQLDTAGPGRQAKPLYNIFIEKAKELNPKHALFIVPARWFGGGMGLEKFRRGMMSDMQIREIVEFRDARDCFPSVDIAGGICYFLWSRGTNGPCKITNISKGEAHTDVRNIAEFDILIRDGRVAEIVKKVVSMTSQSLSNSVLPLKPFGLATNAKPDTAGSIRLFYTGGEGNLELSRVTANQSIIDKWKVITSAASFDHAGQEDKEGKRRVFGKIEVLKPNTVCTESYVVVGSFNTRKEAENLVGFLKTRFVRFLVATRSFSQHINKEKFSFVPSLDWSKAWDDRNLDREFHISAEERMFIDQKIKEM